MTKSEALEVLKQLNPSEKIRLIVETQSVFANSLQSAISHIIWLSQEFSSPKEGYEFGAKETDCIKLESTSFDFALAYNSVMNPAIDPLVIEYTEEQQEQMYSLHYETTQANQIGYLSATKGE